MQKAHPFLRRKQSLVANYPASSSREKKSFLRKRRRVGSSSANHWKLRSQLARIMTWAILAKLKSLVSLQLVKEGVTFTIQAFPALLDAGCENGETAKVLLRRQAEPLDDVGT
jgi:hypothetical protein